MTILRKSIEQREQEVAHYDFNIRNFQRALELAIETPGMEEFRDQLRELLKGHRYERKKAAIMLRVLNERLEEETDDSSD